MADIKTYTEETQELFLRFLLSDPDLFARCQNIVKPDYFNLKYRKAVDLFVSDGVAVVLDLPNSLLPICQTAASVACGSDGHQLAEERVDGVVLAASVEGAPLLLPALEGRVEEEPSLRLAYVSRVGSTGAGLVCVSCRPSHFPCCQWELPSLPSSRVHSVCHC